jgi:uncharacterized protein (UPF0332 family)
VSPDNRRANAAAELASARDALRVAEAALAIGIRRDAMSRLYYAVFHAARAWLLLEGAEPKTHGGVLRMVGELLVRAAKLTPRDQALLTRLQAYRQASDYAYTFDLPPDEAEAQIVEVRGFIVRTEQALKEAGG